RTVLVADETAACHEFARMLGEPPGLSFVTPLLPLTLDIRGVAVDIVSAHGDTVSSPPAVRTGPAPLQRRIVVGWDAGACAPGRWNADSAASGTPAAEFLGWFGASPTWSLPGTLWIWGSRQPQMLPPGVHHLPALQPRSGHEAAGGACCTLTLLERRDEAPGGSGAAPHAEWRGSWHEVPTQRVAWRTLHVESQAGGDEELATAIWSALEGIPAGRQAPLELVRCAVACGTSVARRVRVAEIAAETLARVRQLYDPASFRSWCSDVGAGRHRGGDRGGPGTAAHRRVGPAGGLAGPGTDRVDLTRPSTLSRVRHADRGDHGMFIERIEVERFGALERITIDRLGPGVQVLHGTNETGKTSLLEFVRAVFFGFEGLFRRGVLDPQVACAGRLLVRVPPERTLISVERRHEGPLISSLTRSSYEDDVVGLGGDHGDVIELADVDPRHDRQPRHRLYLQDLVGNIDETAFTSVMAFGLDELHELRTLEPEGCGSRLYELASGLDRSQVSRVLVHLREAPGLQR
ncbi:MAG: hypothetical protein EBR23_11930, partial [Planctomycetia bacterium]|nr:hypothetical protein [Planctomycetia bacterium]